MGTNLDDTCPSQDISEDITDDIIKEEVIDRNSKFYIQNQNKIMEKQKQLINLISNELGISKSFLADKIGKSRQMFNHSVNSGKLTGFEINQILEAARVEVVDGYAIINDIKVKL